MRHEWKHFPISQLNRCTQSLIGANNHHFDTTPTKSIQTQSQNAINLCSLDNNHKIASCKPSHPRTLLMTALTTKFVCVSMCNKREGRGFLSAKREKGNDLCFGKYFTKNFWQNILQLLHTSFLIHKKCFQLWSRFYPQKKHCKILKKIFQQINYSETSKKEWKLHWVSHHN